MRVIIVQGVAAILDGFEAGGNDIRWPRGISPEALREPYVSLSTHTAPRVKTLLRCRSQRTATQTSRLSPTGSLVAHLEKKLQCELEYACLVHSSGV